MSGLDILARGLAAQAQADAGQRSRVLMAAGPSGPVYGGADAEPVTVHSIVLPPDTIFGGATLRVGILIAKYPPNNAGWSWTLRIGEVPLALNFLAGSVATARTEQDIVIASDRKAAFVYNLNTLDTPLLETTGFYTATGVKIGGASALGARAPSPNIMFVAQSEPPTVETVLVDFAQPQTLAIDILVQNGDTAEVLGATIELLGEPERNFASPRATALWGDSLTEGTGAEMVDGVPMDWPAQLRRLRPGWPIAAKGLGGQKSRAIVDRLVADRLSGAQWNAVIWTGANDFDAHIGDGPGWLAAVRAEIDRALAFRSSRRTIVCNLHPRAGWAVGDANYAALQHVNAGLAAAYGPRLCDLFTALATDGGKLPATSMVDDIHLSNAGYAIVAAAVDAKMTALGWA